MQPISLVSVVVPTLNRPEPLARALNSLFRQDGCGDIEIIVVDNAADASARPLVEALSANAPVPLRYVHAAQPGVATARNRGVAAARGDWIAFLDDDEEASPGWIAALCTVAAETGADAVFGPVGVKAEAGAVLGPHGRYFGRGLDVTDQSDITPLAAYLGTNNSLFRRDGCLEGPKPFDETLNQCGGEDSLLLRRLRDRGKRFAWAAAAEVTEWVPPRRLSWAYVTRRRFLSGQIRSFVHRMLDPPRWDGLVLWMAIGAVQAVLAGIAAALLWPIARERARHLSAMAAGGLGKVLWMERFRPGLYGLGLVS